MNLITLPSILRFGNLKEWCHSLQGHVLAHLNVVLRKIRMENNPQLLCDTGARVQTFTREHHVWGVHDIT